MIGPELDAELRYRRERIRADSRPFFPGLVAWLRKKKAAWRGATRQTANPAGMGPARAVRPQEGGGRQ